jgi:hypothetical protein
LVGYRQGVRRQRAWGRARLGAERRILLFWRMHMIPKAMVIPTSGKTPQLSYNSTWSLRTTSRIPRYAFWKYILCLRGFWCKWHTIKGLTMLWNVMNIC